MAESRACKLNNTPIQSNVISSPTSKNYENAQPAALQTTPSTSSTFQLKSHNNLCVADEYLPSANIAELWTRPLKLPFTSTDAISSVKSKSNERRRKNQRTPSRRNVLPPTKLSFEDLDSDEQLLCNKQEVFRVGFRRSMSFPERNSLGETPGCNPKRLKLQTEEKSPYEELMLSKSVLKENNGTQSSSTSLTPAVKKLFVKSQSDSVLSSSCIKTALEKIESNPTLIGDASTTYILPFKKQGNHADLKEISSETLAKLLETKEDCEVTFKVIDCRYPYEFAGGHIRGAINLYTKKNIQDELLETKTTIQVHPPTQTRKAAREILIFHCEFSSRRGPFLCRHLRDVDRTLNASSYPHLFYPELYVLYGGYKDFFEKFSHLCEPQGYVSMFHADHADKYRMYKSESKLGRNN